MGEGRAGQQEREQAQQQEHQRQQEQERQQQEQSRQREQEQRQREGQQSQGTEQEQADRARAQYQADLQKQQEEAYQREHHGPMIGTETRAYVPPANASARSVKAGPMTLRFAIEGLQIFQRYGKRYQVVNQVGGGVLAIDIELDQPKVVVFMDAPTGDELEQTPES